MYILYKYCDQLGIVKILGSLELKLPYISEVNDPLECSPVFRYSDCKNSNQNREKEEKHQRIQEEWNQRTLLLSVSATAQNTVMWAHYSEKHKGAVIGIDFDKVNVKPNIKPSDVKYSKKRPIIKNPSNALHEEWLDTLFTKSKDWDYEKELRDIFTVEDLKRLQQQGFACLKEFNGKKTWFLRLNPESIREVILGLFTEESLKSAIRKLIERPELQHVKLRQAEKSKTYKLKLIDLKDK